MTRYRVWNLTTEKWVRDEDDRVCEFHTAEEAADCKDRLDDIKQLNPEHRNDTYVVQAVEYNFK